MISARENSHNASTILGNRLLLASLSLLCVLLYWLQIDNSLAYHRDDILDGELWRLITGNLLHTNHWHLLMNLAGLWVISEIFISHFRILGLFVLTLGLCFFEGLGLLIFYPDTVGYVGLSGILHGLFAFGALLDTRNGIKLGKLLLAGVVLKVGYEQVAGASEDVATLIGARVATESHLVGMMVGLLCAVCWIALRGYTEKQTENHGSPN